MTGPVRVFINERPVDVSVGDSVRVAVEAFDPALAARLAAGEAYLTDGRGIRCAPETPVTPGAILRVIVSARGVRDADA